MRHTDPSAVLTHINRYGIDQSRLQLEALTRSANQLGVLPAITPLLLDQATPTIVRERAAARVVAAIANQPPRIHIYAA